MKTQKANFLEDITWSQWRKPSFWNGLFDFNKEKPFKKTRVHYFIEKLNQVGLASGLRVSDLLRELRTVDIF